MLYTDKTIFEKLFKLAKYFYSVCFSSTSTLTTIKNDLLQISSLQLPLLTINPSLNKSYREIMHTLTFIPHFSRIDVEPHHELLKLDCEQVGGVTEAGQTNPTIVRGVRRGCFDAPWKCTFCSGYRLLWNNHFSLKICHENV